MKLYYSPFACSLAAHIACREAGLTVTLHRIELGTKRIEGHGDLRDINPMGQVPTLVTDDDRVLTETSAVLTYIADRAPGAQLAAGQDGFARYESLRWLSFVATELHKKCLWQIFAPASPDAVIAHARAIVHPSLAVVDARLAARETLLGAGFSVADAYLWWALLVARHAQIPLEQYPHLRAFYTRHATRPAVAAAVLFERDQHARAFAATDEHRTVR